MVEDHTIKMRERMIKIINISLVLMLILLVGCEDKITNFEECIAAGNPAMESYPAQCIANGETFVEVIACTAEAKICSDGSSVGRTGLDCEFTPCPIETEESLCDNAGGHWNDCSSRCGLMNVANPDILCTAVCEELCECGGVAGWSCPEGQLCKMPEGVVDALGYCIEDPLI